MFAFTGYVYIPLMCEEFDMIIIYIDKFSLFKSETNIVSCLIICVIVLVPGL